MQDKHITKQYQQVIRDLKQCQRQLEKINANPVNVIKILDIIQDLEYEKEEVTSS